MGRAVSCEGLWLGWLYFCGLVLLNPDDFPLPALAETSELRATMNARSEKRMNSFFIRRLLVTRVTSRHPARDAGSRSTRTHRPERPSGAPVSGSRARQEMSRLSG